MQKPFENAFVINLPFKPERLERFFQNVPDCFGEIKVWPAVHGDTVKVPAWWTAGRGAWGCYRSHMQILEHCIQHKVKSYVVFEDDAIFRPGCHLQLGEFIASVPLDWQQVYLGGQLYHEIKNPPKRVNGLVLMPHNVNRTHCFAVHERGYQSLVDHLYRLPFSPNEHIDHHLGRLHESGKFSVYVPNQWLVGQGSGWSNISGKFNEDTYWPNPEDCCVDHELFRNPVCVFLEAPIDVARQLHLRGWHMGYWLNEHGLDRGVCEALGHFYPEIRLREWYEWTQREVVRDKLRIPCLYHPALTIERVQKLGFARWIHIEADTVDKAIEALQQGVAV